MKFYDILQHPSGTVEAIKYGWSWPAFFFTILWAIAKKMWMISSSVIVLFFLLFYFLEKEYAGVIIVIYIILSIIFGQKGNDWRKNKFYMKDYKYIDCEYAGSPKIAEASFLRTQEEERKQAEIKQQSSDIPKSFFSSVLTGMGEKIGEMIVSDDD